MALSDNLAVSQAQRSVAQANDQYVSSLYRNNVAKLSLARALGAGQDYRKYLRAKPVSAFCFEFRGRSPVCDGRVDSNEMVSQKMNTGFAMGGK